MFFHKKEIRNKNYIIHSLLLYFLSFGIPVLVITLALIALQITPFGNHTLAITDAKFYLNGEMWFSRLLHGKENILYSFNNGLGGNEWSKFAWGGFSIGNLLAYFAKLETIPTIFTWICTMNLAFCGLTMYILLSYVNGHQLSNLIFSTSYALIGFNVVNCYQTVFLIGPQILPLMVLGLVMIFRGKNPILYVFSLAFCVFFNFYFGFHLCVFSLIYFITYYCVNEKIIPYGFRRFFIQWLIPSIIGGLLAAPMWLPTLKAYSGGGRLNQTGIVEYTIDENMPFIQIFSKLFSGANSTNELMTGLPNIFCGILVLALVILFFINKNIDIRRKRAAGVVLGIYLLTFYIHAFTLLMHGGTVTNWFPYRYSYVFSFVMICIAVEEFCHFEEISVADAKLCVIVLGIGAMIVFGVKYEFISGGMVVIDFLLLILMWLGFWFYKTRPDKTPLRTFSVLLIILVCINLYVNFAVSTRNVKKWELDLKEYNNNIMVSGALVDALNNVEDGFFRMEKDESESESVAADPALYNYNGVGDSGPAIRMFVHQELSKLGINWFDMRHWYSEGIPAATDKLLGLKYLISKRDLAEEKGYEEKIDLRGYKIFQNPDTLDVAVLANSNIDQTELGNNAFDNLNNIWKSMTGQTDNLFYEQDDVTYSLFSDYNNQSITSKELKESYAFPNMSQSTLDSSQTNQEGETRDNNSSSYILYTFEAKHDGPIYVFDTSIPESSDGLSAPNMKYVGTFHKGDKVEGKIPLTAEISNGDMLRGYCVNQVFAYANNEILEKFTRLLNSREIDFNVIHENDIKGSFTAEGDQRILFTMPWDEGWTCFIDGKKANIDKTWDLFMSVKVPEGQHTYEMKFFPAWMNYGIYLSCMAFLGLFIYMIIWYKKRNKQVSASDNIIRNNSSDSILNVVSDSIDEKPINIENKNEDT